MIHRMRCILFGIYILSGNCSLVLGTPTWTGGGPGMMEAASLGAMVWIGRSCELDPSSLKATCFQLSNLRVHSVLST